MKAFLLASMRHRTARLAGLVLVLLGVVFGSAATTADEFEPGQGARTFKVLHIMSYHSPWRWTDGQFESFKEELRGLPIEYQVFQMDTKRNSTETAKRMLGVEAAELIAQWKPDLVYTSDDDAQDYVTRHFANTDIPFVFSGVNKAPGVYGLDGATNVSGVLEEEHFVESVRLLRQIAPNVRRIAAVFDDSSLWDPVRQRMKARMSELPGVEIVAWDTIRTFADYKRMVAEYPSRADAIALIGIFNFRDEHGANVPYEEVLRWTAENSRLPDFSFWIDRVHFGTFPVRPTVKGVPVVSLARAKSLGIQVKSTVLLSSEIVKLYEWAK
jgi:hypothetical protein